MNRYGRKDQIIFNVVELELAYFVFGRIKFTHWNFPSLPYCYDVMMSGTRIFDSTRSPILDSEWNRSGTRLFPALVVISDSMAG